MFNVMQQLQLLLLLQSKAAVKLPPPAHQLSFSTDQIVFLPPSQQRQGTNCIHTKKLNVTRPDQ